MSRSSLAASNAGGKLRSVPEVWDAARRADARPREHHNFVAAPHLQKIASSCAQTVTYNLHSPAEQGNRRRSQSWQAGLS